MSVGVQAADMARTQEEPKDLHATVESVLHEKSHDFSLSSAGQSSSSFEHWIFARRVRSFTSAAPEHHCNRLAAAAAPHPSWFEFWWRSCFFF
jgi:hypothetical protein